MLAILLLPNLYAKPKNVLVNDHYLQLLKHYSRIDGSYDKLLRDLSKPDLLILDDFGLKEITVDLSQDLLEMIDDRWRHKKSVGISSQLPVKEWPNVFADLTICDSIMDRTVRNARINLKGPSRRPSLFVA